MASSHSTSGLSQEMEKLSVNGKRHADAPRYTPPHRKYAQATKISQTSTPAPSNDRREPTATLSEASSVEGTAVSEDTTSAASKGMEETETAPTIAQEQPADSEPKPKTTPRSMPPHKKYSNTSTASTTKAPAKGPEVAESWEEEATSDKDDTKTQSSTKPTSATSTANDHTSSPAQASVPKSTYLPPHLKYRSAAPSPPSRTLTPPSSTPPTSRPAPSASTSNPTTSERRPEKTNAVAHRLIAGALGVKVPRRTEEQRAYDKAIREQEKKKRDAEREAKKKAEEDAIRAKAAIWED